MIGYPGMAGHAGDPTVAGFRLGQGEVGAPSLIMIVEVNGTPCGCPVLGIDPLDSEGFRECTVAVTLPPTEIRLQGFSLIGSQLVSSGVETIVVE